ncbi:MAG: insulinase family protein, partial [Candidatus Cloacimonetes bacterium]|nr:insulinase family protein [Candidatus Cloacimonadota bacterium]
REKIEPYVDTEIPETLLSEMPKAGSIVKESVRKDSGIKEWILSNGVRVYSKQTDFKKDEILFAAKSPGGYSEYPLAQSFDARFLGDYLYLTGAGEHDRASLVKALTGKIAEIGFNVDSSSHQINGSTTPKDLETLFQLIYLFGTQARFDEQSFGVYTATIGPSMEFISNEANLVFADSLASIRWQRHPMLRNKNINHFNSLEPSSLQQIHRDLFGNYADFTFLFVGSFDEDALKEYCKTYLANLPVGKKKGKLEAKAIAPFSGKETVSFKKGSTASAQVTHITSGYCEMDTDSAFARLALNMLLTRKLLENIRERMSGVYVIYSQYEEIEHSGNGRPAYSLAINMHCDPLREEELSAAIMATLDSLRAGYYDESYVQEIKAQLSKVYEDAFGTNEYFCKVISKNLYSPREIDCYLQNPGRIEKLDKKIITDAAKRHLSFDKSHRKLVMLPEDPISLE